MALSEKTRVSVNLVGFLSILVGAITGTNLVVSEVNKGNRTLEKIHETVETMRAEGWRVSDQVDYSYQLERINAGVPVKSPDPKTIVLQRIDASTKGSTRGNTLSAATAPFISPQ